MSKNYLSLFKDSILNKDKILESRPSVPTNLIFYKKIYKLVRKFRSFFLRINNFF